MPETPTRESGLDDSRESEQGPRYAWAIQRAAAMLIDTFVLGLLFAAADSIRRLAPEGPWGPDPGPFSSWTMIYAAIACLYLAVLESSRIQGTIGKFLIGIKVVTAHGDRLSSGSALVRSLVKVICWPWGCLFSIVSSKRQTLHDFSVNSLVVRR